MLYRKKYLIQPNPVLQNETHIRALRELLGSKIKAPIINIVVFPSAERFIIDGYENVGSVNDLYNSIAGHKQQIYKYTEARDIIEQICDADMKSSEAHAYHVRNIKAVHTV